MSSDPNLRETALRLAIDVTKAANGTMADCMTAALTFERWIADGELPSHLFVAPGQEPAEGKTVITFRKHPSADA